MPSSVFFIKFPQNMNKAPQQVLVIDILGEGEVEINFHRKEAYFRQGDLLSQLKANTEYLLSNCPTEYRLQLAKDKWRHLPDYRFTNPMTGAKYTLLLSPHEEKWLQSEKGRQVKVAAHTMYVVLNDVNEQMGGVKFTGQGEYRVLH